LDVNGVAKATQFLQGTDYHSPYQGFRNHLANGGFDVWQRGTSIAGLNNATSYAADRWAIFRSSAANYTLSRVAVVPSELTGFNYCARYQRTAGDTSSQPLYLARTFESISVIPLAGKTVTYSFYARKGANYSTAGNNLFTQIEFGNGTDLPFLTQPTSSSITSMTSALTASWQRFQTTLTVPTTATAARIYSYTSPTGTAGVNDYFEVTGVQLEIGSVATPFEQRPIQTELALCQRYYWRHTGFSSGPYFGGGTADASSGIYITVQHPVPMRVPPTSIDVVANITDTTNTIAPSAVSIYLAGTLSTTIRNTYPVYVQYRWHTYILNNAGFYVGCSSEL
jgi:hypothetical protein